RPGSEREGEPGPEDQHAQGRDDAEDQARARGPAWNRFLARHDSEEDERDRGEHDQGDHNEPDHVARARVVAQVGDRHPDQEQDRRDRADRAVALTQLPAARAGRFFRGGHAYAAAGFSTIVASPCPPPMHILATPYRTPPPRLS